MENVPVDAEMALTKVNGFCDRKCQDLYMTSLLVSMENRYPHDIPVTRNRNVFEHPPWDLPLFFRRNLLPNEDERAWVFRHDNVPLRLRRMANFFGYSCDRYQTVRVNGIVISVQFIEFSYFSDHKHSNGVVCMCPHAHNRQLAAGWIMYRYRFRENSVFLLSWKRRGSKPVIQRDKSDRSGFEGGDEERYEDDSEQQAKVPPKKRAMTRKVNRALNNGPVVM